MLLKSFKTTFLQELSSLYDEREIESFFYLVLEHFHAMKRIDLALNPNMEIDESQFIRWEKVLVELKLQKPIQYILGETEFYGLRFLVNENTLIPRPETEELVEWIIVESAKSKVKSINILDIGTGSGCIAISLAKNLSNATVFALDVSEKALATAQKNAEINNVVINFINADVLKLSNFDFAVSTKFDLIVSNPPYVRHLEKAEINKNVLENEPHLALFVEDDDALIFYRKIALLAQENLLENGQLYFEINQYLGNETRDLLVTLNFQNIELRKDIYGNDRMLFCNKI